MKIALICFSLTGQETGEKLCCGLEKAGITAVLAKKSKYLPDSIKVSTSAWAGEKFPDSDALIFIGATGIAVRSIAPYVASKKSDPAVLVIDECGRFVISLLSGHLGGANELALKAAEILHAVPVVTTALLAVKNVGFYSEFPVEGKLPEGLVLCDEYGKPVRHAQDDILKDEESFGGCGDLCRNTGSIMADEAKTDCGVAVTVHTSCRPFPYTTQVVPKCLTLGLGCRKGKDAE